MARTMDLALFAHNAGLPPEQVTAEIGCRVDQLERAYREIEQKRSTTRYLHAPPLLIEPVAEVRHPSAGTG